jgi:hypothetical protein
MRYSAKVYLHALVVLSCICKAYRLRTVLVAATIVLRRWNERWHSKCAHGRLFNLDYEDDAIVTWRLLAQLKHKVTHGRARTGDSRCILTLCRKRPQLVIVRSGANMLTIFLPIGVSPSNNTRSQVKCLIFLSDSNRIWNFSIEMRYNFSI